MTFQQMRSLLRQYDVKPKKSIMAFYNKVRNLSESDFSSLIRSTRSFLSKKKITTSDLEMFLGPPSERVTHQPRRSCNQCYGTGIVVALRGNEDQEFYCNRCAHLSVERDIKKWSKDYELKGWRMLV